MGKTYATLKELFSEWEKEPRRYSIEEIKQYLEGWKYFSATIGEEAIENEALKNAINQLNDNFDGIKSVTERLKQ